MTEIIKSSAASVIVSIGLGAAVWWSLVEVRLASAEVKIEANRESLTSAKAESKDALREIKQQVAVVDEKITSVLLLLSKGPR